MARISFARNAGSCGIQSNARWKDARLQHVTASSELPDPAILLEQEREVGTALGRLLDHPADAADLAPRGLGRGLPDDMKNGKGILFFIDLFDFLDFLRDRERVGKDLLHRALLGLLAVLAQQQPERNVIVRFPFYLLTSQLHGANYPNKTLCRQPCGVPLWSRGADFVRLQRPVAMDGAQWSSTTPFQLPLSYASAAAYNVRHGERPIDPSHHHGEPHLLCRGLQRPSVHQAAAPRLSCELCRVVHLHGNVRSFLRGAVRGVFSRRGCTLAEAAIRRPRSCGHRVFLVRRSIPLLGPCRHEADSDRGRRLFLPLFPRGDRRRDLSQWRLRAAGHAVREGHPAPLRAGDRIQRGCPWTAGRRSERPGSGRFSLPFFPCDPHVQKRPRPGGESAPYRHGDLFRERPQ